jgi:hypothetical protein
MSGGFVPSIRIEKWLERLFDPGGGFRRLDLRAWRSSRMREGIRTSEVSGL